MALASLSLGKRPLRRQLIRLVPYLVGSAILVILPPLLPSYFQVVIAKVLIFAVFAMSLDLLFGYAGLFAFGHAAFFGIGGYTAGLLSVRYGVDSFWVGAFSGILVAALLAAVFGLIALRVSGIYFLLVTFALGQLLVSAATKWRFLSTTGSTEGVINIPRPDLGFGEFSWSNISFYYLVFVVFIVCVFLLLRVVNSPFGRSLQGIRESELRMRALGYDVWLHKYIAFIVAAAFAGMAGVLIAYHDGFMVPASFGVFNSALALLMVIIGGVGTLYGPVIGAAALILIEVFASMYTPERWPLILGAAFVAAVMFARGGIIIYLNKLWQRVVVRWKL